MRFGTGYVHIFVEADLVSVFFLLCGLVYEFACGRFRVRLSYWRAAGLLVISMACDLG